MSAPSKYARSFSFSNWQAANPSLSLPGSQVDLELNNVLATLNGTLASLALIQRNDGALANASVGLDQLSPQVVVGFNAPTVWVTGTAYAANSSTVFNGSGFYNCLVAHTSGVFATDLAAGFWRLIVNLAAVPLTTAAQVAVTPSGSLTSNVQTSLQALDVGKAPLAHTQLSSTISDSTAAGRALLTAANVAAQNTLLGTTLLGFQSGDVKETAGLVLQSGWYYCDGSNKNRVTDAPLFNAITIQQSGTTTSGSPIVTGLSDTTNGGNTPLSPGVWVSGTGVPANTVILSVDSSSQVTLNQNCTSSSTTSLVFAPYGVGDGSSTFGIPNRAYVAVGRDNASGSASNIMQVSTSISLTNGSTTATVASATGLFVGMYIGHPKLPFGATIVTISGTTITMSGPATGTVSGSAARFSPVVDAQTVGSTGGTLTQTTTLVTTNLPPYTPAGSVSGSGAVAITPATPFVGTAGGVTLMAPGGGTPVAITASFTGTAASGQNSTPIIKPTVQPTIVMNFVIKR